jgi:hypothetical protein
MKTPPLEVIERGSLVRRCLALEGLHESRPVSKADPQYRPVTVVFRVSYGDVSRDVGDLYTVAALPAAV